MEFVQFGIWHLSVFAFILAVGFLFSIMGRKSERSLFICRLILVAMCFSVLTFYYSSKFILGWLSVQNDLPMHLCDWAMIACIATLIYPNQTTFELAYFWGLGGTLNALITPNIQEGFPDISFFIFFSTHSVTIIVIIFLVAGCRFRVYLSSVVKVFFISQIYLLTALIINRIFNSNYGFLTEKPTESSLLDYMGDQPYYIFNLEVLTLISFFVLYLPFYFCSKFTERTENQSKC